LPIKGSPYKLTLRYPSQINNIVTFCNKTENWILLKKHKNS
jgi:hypothetical protein